MKGIWAVYSLKHSKHVMCLFRFNFFLLVFFLFRGLWVVEVAEVGIANTRRNIRRNTYLDNGFNSNEHNRHNYLGKSNQKIGFQETTLTWQGYLNHEADNNSNTNNSIYFHSSYKGLTLLYSEVSGRISSKRELDGYSSRHLWYQMSSWTLEISMLWFWFWFCVGSSQSEFLCFLAFFFPPFTSTWPH